MLRVFTLHCSKAETDVRRPRKGSFQNKFGRTKSFRDKRTKTFMLRVFTLHCSKPETQMSGDQEKVRFRLNWSDS